MKKHTAANNIATGLHSVNQLRLTPRVMNDSSGLRSTLSKIGTGRAYQTSKAVIQKLASKPGAHVISTAAKQLFNVAGSTHMMGGLIIPRTSLTDPTGQIRKAKGKRS